VATDSTPSWQTSSGTPRSGASASSILRYVFWHSLMLAVLVGVLVLLQAYVFPGVVPG